MEDLLILMQNKLSLIITGLVLTLVLLLLMYGLMLRFQQKREDAAIRAEEDFETSKKNLKKTASTNLLSTPEALAKDFSTHTATSQASPREKDVSVELSLLSYQLQKARQAVRDRVLPDSLRENFDNILEAGKHAMDEERWDLARKYLEEALKLAPEETEVYIKLAIVCYEQADLSASEKYYREAINKHPHAGTSFRKHLAFRV